MNTTKKQEEIDIETIKIRSLTLKNFKGIKELDIAFGGSDANIFGDNATGKTTIADADNWLLFDKDSQNRSTFEIKTLNDDNEPFHGLDHSVKLL